MRKVPLKPCPQCGGEAERFTNDPYNDTLGVGCEECSIFDNSSGKTMSGATKAWNRGNVNDYTNATN